MNYLALWLSYAGFVGTVVAGVVVLALVVVCCQRADVTADGSEETKEHDAL